jgi:hypothetical protein
MYGLKWRTQRDHAGELVAPWCRINFIRRGQYDWDDPAKLVGSLVA